MLEPAFVEADPAAPGQRPPLSPSAPQPCQKPPTGCSPVRRLPDLRGQVASQRGSPQPYALDADSGQASRTPVAHFTLANYVHVNDEGLAAGAVALGELYRKDL